jgi:hypothetical protein
MVTYESKPLLFRADGNRLLSMTKKKVNKRSRGRHEPGDGEYWNRWVTAPPPYLKKSDGSIAGYFSLDERWYDKDSSGLFQEGGEHNIFWDGVHFASYSIGKLSGAAAQTGCWRAIWQGLVIVPDPRPQRYGSNYYYYHCYGTGKQTNSITMKDGSKESYAMLDGLVRSRYEEFKGASSTNIWYRELDAWAPRYLDGILVEPEPQFSADVMATIARIEEHDASFNAVESLTANAFVDAANNLPSLMSMNNCANIITLLKLALSVFTDKGLAVEKGGRLLKSAWLGYRYSYGTTKQDIQEAANYLDRAADLIGMMDLTSNGTYHYGDITARCSLTVSNTELQQLQSTIERYGMQLNGYALWDMVPYSFIVDWFVDVGGWLQWAEQRKVAFRLDTSRCWYSIERRFKNEFNCDEIYYQRFRWSPYVAHSSYTSHSASVRTTLKRAIDLIALFG